jgi:nitroimidazol reductase NimA-like FMN-containing flavoprotein (pyridoxamine 5'-phosphate oxidase superfamily)/MOSC domain-containing protein YiiM
MAKNYLQQERTAVRRSDRAVTDDVWIKQFLHSAAVGTLATVHEGQPFVNTNLFLYDEDEGCIYTHTARLGRTQANVRASQQVCFSIMEMGRLLPAPQALEFSVEYAGVTVFGTASIVEDDAEATRVLQALLDKYAPHLQAGEDYRPPVPEELKRTAVFRIDIEEWSGKKKEVDEHPGAFWYRENPALASVRERNTWRGSLQEIFIAPEVGAPIASVESVEVVAGFGLRGDRNFAASGDISSGVGVTLVALEDIQAVNHNFDIPITPAQTRRNLLTQGVPLNALVGKRFRIGDVILEGVELCEPCNSLARTSGYGNRIISAMLHRGGLRADILQGGTIRAGDRIEPVEIDA